jgi:uncharacterized protein with ParB-like and HNH nuclease domain
MAVLNIEKSFLTENRSVLDFFNQSGQGLYIPLYQRDYSWDSDNIEQLLEDLTRGIQRIASGEVNDDSKEIRFLGTIITVVEPNRDHIYPVEIQAVPSRIEKLIDGQQRASTIALMATLLTKRLTEIKNKVKSDNPIYEQVNEICNIWIDQKLATIFSFDLGRGTPRLKPKIIRGAKDYWTRSNEVDDAYKSELANFLGHFIKAYSDGASFPCLNKEKYGNSLLYQNGKKIESWLKKTVSTAHEEQNDDDFSNAEKILSHFSQDHLWEFERPELVEMIKEKNFSDKKTNSYILCELVQTLSVCHYLLDRCCFTIIQPTDDDWAFDMFQSLNATGTPLTAIETFKPTVVNTVDGKDGHQFKDSNSDKSFKKVEYFLSDATTAAQKNKRTNDYLTSFFVAFDGRTMSTHFSYQRKVLNNVYESLTTFEEKEDFVRKMGNYAEFYQNWIKYDGKDNSPFPKIGTSPDADLASMLILFLKSSNHKMAITILGSVYNLVIEQEPDSSETFICIVKAVAAYYFLWRSAFSNSGLDSTYREFFKKKETISIDKIKTYLKDVLKNKEIDTLESWKCKAKNYQKYTSSGKDVIRLALLISAHDTIPDEANAGLIKVGRDNCSKYLSVEKWISPDLKTIEHIAPQSDKNNMWDASLYETHVEPYQTIGNLTLLPQEINSSVGNKGWKEKLLYYQSVAEKDPAKIDEIEHKATECGINLNASTIELLKNSRFNEHLSAISSVSANCNWNRDLVDRRTEVMLDIIWDRVSKWIF